MKTEQEFYNPENINSLVKSLNRTIELEKTIEEKVKESGIDYQIDGEHILIGKPLEDYDRAKGMETERALEEEAETNRWMEQHESDFYKYYDGELNE